MEWSESANVRVDEIEVDLGLQMRASEPASDEYEEELRKSRRWPFPPLRCVRVGDRLLLVSGFTRYRAALARELAVVPVEISEGTWKDAVREACGENATHGFRRTNVDKRRAVKRCLAEVSQSVTTVAKVCKVSRDTVYRILKEERADVEPALAPPEPERDELEPVGLTEPRARSGAQEADEESEIDTVCPVCGSVSWVPTDGGYECRTCSYELGEAGGLEEGEEHTAAPRGDRIAAGVAEEVSKARTAYGQLHRALARCGLSEELERPMLKIHKRLQELYRSAGRSD